MTSERCVLAQTNGEHNDNNVMKLGDSSMVAGKHHKVTDRHPAMNSSVYVPAAFFDRVVPLPPPVLFFAAYLSILAHPRC